jgi:hypothetical protein
MKRIAMVSVSRGTILCVLAMTTASEVDKALQVSITAQNISDAQRTPLYSGEGQDRPHEGEGGRRATKRNRTPPVG